MKNKIPKVAIDLKNKSINEIADLLANHPIMIEDIREIGRCSKNKIIITKSQKINLLKNAREI